MCARLSSAARRPAGHTTKYEGQCPTLRLAHEGHQGIVKTKNRLRAKVWWPKMNAAAEKLCRSCHGCQVVGELSAP